jgi:hypothetical protein
MCDNESCDRERARGVEVLDEAEEASTLEVTAHRVGGQHQQLQQQG